MWPVVYGPRAARVGWWLESRAAPRIYRHAQYVAVSEATRDELVELGVPTTRVAVVHNGVDPPRAAHVGRDPVPTITVLGRLVPHKQVSHVLQAARSLREEFPELAVRVVGDGWWGPELHQECHDLGVDEVVTFTGFVDEQQKGDELARTWVLAIPSLKEGWGLVVVEAGTYGVPAVGYRSAAGVAESIVDEETGLVVDGGPEDLTAALRRILADPELRDRLGAASRLRAELFSWRSTVTAFAAVLAGAARRLPPVYGEAAGPDANHAGLGVDEAVVRPVTLDGPAGPERN
jgi:glycosyltransferase involved in cell wall biosynthesis